jgi:hypothetical protein
MSTQVRNVLFVPLGGSKTNGAHVDEVVLPSGTVVYSVWGSGTSKIFGTAVEAFDHAFMVMGWNATVTERHTDDDD